MFSLIKSIDHKIRLKRYNINNKMASYRAQKGIVQSPTKVRRLSTDKLLSYTDHDGEGYLTIHQKVSLCKGRTPYMHITPYANWMIGHRVALDRATRLRGVMTWHVIMLYC